MSDIHENYPLVTFGASQQLPAERFAGIDELIAAATKSAGSPVPILEALTEISLTSWEEVQNPILATWELLATISSIDLAAARTLEPHLDALSFLREADRNGAGILFQKALRGEFLPQKLQTRASRPQKRPMVGFLRALNHGVRWPVTFHTRLSRHGSMTLAAQLSRWICGIQVSASHRHINGTPWDCGTLSAGPLLCGTFPRFRSVLLSGTSRDQTSQQAALVLPRVGSVEPWGSFARYATKQRNAPRIKLRLRGWGCWIGTWLRRRRRY